MNEIDFVDVLNEEIALAERSRHEAVRLCKDPNSFGAGYDLGYLDGLRDARELFHARKEG